MFTGVLLSSLDEQSFRGLKKRIDPSGVALPSKAFVYWGNDHTTPAGELTNMRLIDGRLIGDIEVKMLNISANFAIEEEDGDTITKSRLVAGILGYPA